MWKATDEPTPGKSIASVHPTLPFSVAISQRLFGCLGLFIPPSTHAFEIAGLYGSAGEFKTPRRSYPIHPSA
jgi:hypothetical protein